MVFKLFMFKSLPNGAQCENRVIEKIEERLIEKRLMASLFFFLSPFFALRSNYLKAKKRLFISEKGRQSEIGCVFQFGLTLVI